MAKAAVNTRAKTAKKVKTSTLRFESVRIEPLFEVLDAIAWIDSPSNAAISQYAGIDGRTAGKILKNAAQIGLVTQANASTYMLTQPYPFKGTVDQKKAVVKEALLKLPLIVSIRQFLTLGNDLPSAMRKAATVAGELDYNQAAIAPLVAWARPFDVLDLNVRVESLVDIAVAAKQERHSRGEQGKIAFISHSSQDKKFVRQLASDLVSNGIRVWIDEQQIKVGDSIPEKVAQGLAESDFYLIVNSHNSIASPWVQKELNGALVREIEKREVKVLPIRLDDAPLPASIADKLYADFSSSYADGFSRLVDVLKGEGA